MLWWGCSELYCCSSMFAYDGFVQWFHTLPTPNLQWVAVTDEQCGGMCLLLRGGGSQEKKKAGGEKAVGLENYTTLALIFFVKPLKKSRWKVELKKILSIEDDMIVSSTLCSLNNFMIRSNMLIT